MRARALPWSHPVAGAGAAALATWCAISVLVVVAIGGASFPAQPGLSDSLEGHDPPSAFARADIPPGYLLLYLRAGRAYRLDWAVLAAIGKVECDHGRAPDASCTRVGATNSAGAGGPMQFLGSTWATYGRDGNGDGFASRWDPADAIYSAAAYLTASGAAHDVQRAIFAYNHSRAYVETVERWAERYRGANAEVAQGGREGAGGGIEGETSTPVELVEGERARLAPANPHLALIPVAVPLVVQAMVVAGNELQSLPYCPAGHPDPLGAPNEDCSSSTNYVLYRSGIRSLADIIRTNPLAQSYVRWGEPGPGRWVTIYATAGPSPHVFIVIAGLRLDTSHNGTDTGPNSHEDGPRWRVFDRIPGWAHWSVRHPPGL